MKKAAGVPLSKPRRPSGPQLGKPNAGVAERSQRDRLQAPVRFPKISRALRLQQQTRVQPHAGRISFRLRMMLPC